MSYLDQQLEIYTDMLEDLKFSETYKFIKCDYCEDEFVPWWNDVYKSDYDEAKSFCCESCRVDWEEEVDND